MKYWLNRPLEVIFAYLGRIIGSKKISHLFDPMVPRTARITRWWFGQ
jgi:hypothetical protein